MKTALITGITGQDGSFLAELLLSKNYKVFGMTRRLSVSNLDRIKHLLNNKNLVLLDGDMADSTSVFKVVSQTQPDEIYNLAAQSYVDKSFEIPEYYGNVNGLGILRILEAIKSLHIESKVKVFQASASDMFGKVEMAPQNEATPLSPYSPYAVSKQFAHSICKQYRETYGMFIVTGIMYNHESERRGEEYVTRKITLAAARIAEGLQDHLELGNMDSCRDWGYAKDYVECMWLALQQDEPDDYIISTGIEHSVKDFAKRAFKENGIELVFKGSNENEKAYDKKTGKMLICSNPNLYRPFDAENLVGDPTKAKQRLGWNPLKTPYEKMVSIMAKHDRSLVINKAKK